MRPCVTTVRAAPAAQRLMQDLRSAKSAGALLKIAESQHYSFDAIHACTCLRRIAVLRTTLSRHQARGAGLRRLARMQREDLARNRLNGFGVAATAWTTATLQFDAPVLLRSVPLIADKAAALCSQMTAQGMATTAWALATLELPQVRASSFLRALRRQARLRLREFSAQDLAFTVWALAFFGERDDALLAEAAVLAVRLSGHFAPKGLANTLWGFATLGMRPSGLLRAVATRAAEFSPDDLANTACSLVLWVGAGSRGFPPVAGAQSVSPISRFHGLITYVPITSVASPRICERL